MLEALNIIAPCASNKDLHKNDINPLLDASNTSISASPSNSDPDNPTASSSEARNKANNDKLTGHDESVLKKNPISVPADISENVSAPVERFDQVHAVIH